MYNCEKLAKGGKSRFNSDERKHCIYQEPENYKIEKNKFEYIFGDPRKYRIQIELYEDRPRGRILSKRK